MIRKGKDQKRLNVVVVPHIVVFYPPEPWEIDGNNLKRSNLLLDSTNKLTFIVWRKLIRKKGVESM